MRELTRRGHAVIGCDIKHQASEKEIRCDIADYRQLDSLLSKGQFEMVFHLAAEFGRINGELYYEQVWQSNVVGTRNILELQKRYGFKLIFASSSEIYGDLREPILFESLNPGPISNDYALSKWVNEQQISNFRKRYQNQIMTLRFFNAYGPGEYYTPYRSVVCLFCYRALHDLSYEVYENYHRVFMYIDDFIPTLANCADKFIDGEVINIGGKEYRSVKELSDIILNTLEKKDSKVIYLPEDKHNIVNKRPCIEKANALLGHNPKVVLEEGIRYTLNWMKLIYPTVTAKPLDA